ncbi:serine hydrolase domain-containing protein [Streptodolium elevatio]
MFVLSGGLVACGGGKSTSGKSTNATNSPSGNPSVPPEWESYRSGLERLAAEGTFAGSVLIAKDGQPILASGFGLADRSRKIPNDVATKFCVASIGKSFTSVAIARLAEQRKLAFEDPVGKHVPGLPAAIADRVTIHHLLTHTSGMGDVLGPGTAFDPAQSVAGLMPVIAAQPLAFEPGSRFQYSNSGFITLGAVIEHASGESYADHLRRQVFTPAGMTDTGVQPYKPVDVPNMAHGYALVGADGKVLPPGSSTGTVNSSDATLRDIADQVQFANPSGAAYSTVTDLFNFARAVSENRLLGPEMTNVLLTGKDLPNRGPASGGPPVLSGGPGGNGQAPAPGGPPGGPPGGAPSRVRYAYGFQDETLDNTRIVGHNGGTPGYGGQLDIYLGRGTIVVVLCNQDSAQMPSEAIRGSREILAR